MMRDSGTAPATTTRTPAPRTSRGSTSWRSRPTPARCWIQFERALERLDAGTYGLCEICGKPIGKARMQAFPRATLCVECKQKQERRVLIT